MLSNTANWQQALKNVITNPHDLIKCLELDINLLPAAERAAKLFPLRVPKGFVARMQKGNINDPLLKQVLPLDAELNEVPGFSLDPLQESTYNPISGLIHKYQNRVLLTVTGACAINCRYCFRRHFPYNENNPGSSGWEKALTYIESDTSIKEVILSGGDPLLATDKALKNLIDKIASIPHIKILRIHSRLPIVLPERITDNLITYLTSTRLKVVMVLHCNHANEIDDTVFSVVELMRAAKITTLNQAVLLKGVNDSVTALVNLSEALFEIGILPYYLHLLDKVQGAAHFEVEEGKAKVIYQTLATYLPGYLVPKFVYEQPGALSKLPFDKK